VDDDRRAGTIIQRMRAMLKKDAPSAGAQDLNTLAGEVARLVGNDALLLVVVRTSCEGRDRVVLSIEDSGKGIAPAENNPGNGAMFRCSLPAWEDRI
jgi:hypothetical protein